MSQLPPLTELPILRQLLPLTDLPILSGLPSLTELPPLSQLLAPLTKLPILSQLPPLTELPILRQLLPLTDLPILSGLPSLLRPSSPPAALPQSPGLPALPQLAAPPQSPPTAGFSTTPAAAQLSDLLAGGPDEFIGPVILRSARIGHARSKFTPAAPRPPTPQPVPEPIDRSASTERTSESAGHSSPAAATVPASWLPEPLAWGPASAADPSAARGRAIRYSGPPS